MLEKVEKGYTVKVIRDPFKLDLVDEIGNIICLSGYGEDAKVVVDFPHLREILSFEQCDLENIVQLPTWACQT